MIKSKHTKKNMDMHWKSLWGYAIQWLSLHPLQTGGSDGIKAASVSALKSRWRDERSSDRSSLQHLLPVPLLRLLSISLTFTLYSPHQTYNFQDIIIIIFPPTVRVCIPTPHQSKGGNDSTRCSSSFWQVCTELKLWKQLLWCFQFKKYNKEYISSLCWWNN